jgi:hypothetical protein
MQNTNEKDPAMSTTSPKATVVKGAAQFIEIYDKRI